jgi:hypothetical protein
VESTAAASASPRASTRRRAVPHARTAPGVSQRLAMRRTGVCRGILPQRELGCGLSLDSGPDEQAKPRPRSSERRRQGIRDLLEWRIGRENPVAAILQIWGVDASPAGGNAALDELVLLKVRPEGSCWVVTVPARRPNANEVVRAMSSQVSAMPYLARLMALCRTIDLASNLLRAVAVAMADDEFVEVIVYDSIEDDIAEAYALSNG